jgi:pilus assembly protein TadC
MDGGLLMGVWPSIETGYALAAISLAALVYTIVAVTRFMASQLSTIEKISTTLDNHLSEVADRLATVASALSAVERLLNHIDDNISRLEDSIRGS